MFLWSGQKGKDAMTTDTRIGGGASVRVYRHPLLATINPYLQGLEDGQDPAARCWTPHRAATAAVLLAYDAPNPLFIRWENAALCLSAPTSVTVRRGGTYNGLMKALARQAPTVLPRLRADLRRHVRAALTQVPRTWGWVLLAVDGTKEELPRTAANEAAFGIADNGGYPQILLSAIVEVHTGLLWDWRIAPARGSEKRHLQEMAGALPREALLLADANYVGYDLWATLVQARRAFLIRVGGNVRLLTALFPEADLRQHGTRVYAWPRGKQGTCPPLRLRLLRVGSPRHWVWLLTNVLEPARLSRRAAGAIYRLRWGAEVFYRGFKRTLEHVKLRSRAAGRATLELQWALIACTILVLAGVRALARARQDPRRLSVAGLRHAFRQALRPYPAPTATVGHAAFRLRLARGLRDDYVRRRPKRSRYRPRTRLTPKTHRLKPPHHRSATAREQRRAQQLWPKLAA